MQIVLDIKNPNEVTLVLQYIQSLPSVKIVGPDALSERLVRKKTRRHTAKSLKALQEIIAKGGDASYFGDAAAWQRNEREDRTLPFH
jgi:hypothetical protein